MGFIIADAFSGGGNDYASIASSQEAQRKKAITEGTTAIDNAFSGFNKDFYNSRAKAYEAFALPQLSKQYNDAASQVGFNLSNRGIQKSGAANKSWQDLADTMSTAKQGIVDTGTQQAQQLESQIQAAKSSELQDLYSSADPAGAGAQATATAASFAVPQVLPAVANQFNNLLTQYYTSQLINAYRPLSFTQPIGDASANPVGPSVIQGKGY